MKHRMYACTTTHKPVHEDIIATGVVWFYTNRHSILFHCFFYFFGFLVFVMFHPINKDHDQSNVEVDFRHSKESVEANNTLATIVLLLGCTEILWTSGQGWLGLQRSPILSTPWITWSFKMQRARLFIHLFVPRVVPPLVKTVIIPNMEVRFWNSGAEPNNTLLVVFLTPFRCLCG